MAPLETMMTSSPITSIAVAVNGIGSVIQNTMASRNIASIRSPGSPRFGMSMKSGAQNSSAPRTSPIFCFRESGGALRMLRGAAARPVRGFGFSSTTGSVLAPLGSGAEVRLCGSGAEIASLLVIPPGYAVWTRLCPNPEFICAQPKSHCSTSEKPIRSARRRWGSAWRPWKPDSTQRTPRSPQRKPAQRGPLQSAAPPGSR